MINISNDRHSGSDDAKEPAAEDGAQRCSENLAAPEGLVTYWSWYWTCLSWYCLYIVRAVCWQLTKRFWKHNNDIAWKFVSVKLNPYSKHYRKIIFTSTNLGISTVLITGSYLKLLVIKICNCILLQLLKQFHNYYTIESNCAVMFLL